MGWSGHHIDDTIPVSAPPPGIGPCDLHEVGLARDEVEEYYEGFSQRDALAALPRRRRHAGRSTAHWWDATCGSTSGSPRRAAEAGRPGRHGLGARLPAAAGAGDAARRCGPTCGSASSCTSRSRRPSCSCSCRGAARSSRACSAPTWSASSTRAAPRTSSRWPTGCSGSRRATTTVDVLIESVDGARRVRRGAFPISIDTAEYRRARPRPERPGARPGDPRRRSATRRTILLGVDRLDYTKGIDVRLSAVRASCSPRAAVDDCRDRPGRDAEPGAASRTTNGCATRSSSWSAASTATTARIGQPADPLPAPAAAAGGARRALRRRRRHARDAATATA